MSTFCVLGLQENENHYADIRREINVQKIGMTYGEIAHSADTFPDSCVPDSWSCARESLVGFP